MRLLFRRPLIFLILLTLIGAFFRFYNLNWGAPYYFHPDERNIAFSIIQLHAPDQLNPNFFAYGSLPIYSIYFTGLMYNLLFKNPDVSVAASVGFDQAIIISRFYSAFFSTLLIPLLYLLGKKLQGNATGVLAATFTTLSVGFLQFARFGTFEMWITFFATILFLLSIILVKKNSFPLFVFSAIVAGILISIKVSNVVLLIFPMLPLLLQKPIRELLHHKKKLLFHILKILGSTIFLVILASCVYLVTNPFVILAFDSFQGSMRYESGVALGTIPVFYTHEFFETTPVLFQFLHVYPFLLNPLLTVLFVASFVYLLFITAKTKQKMYFLLLSAFLILFISQAFMFVKWTRYLVPTLPFMYLIIAIALISLVKRYLAKDILRAAFITLPILCCLLFAVSFFITVSAAEDTRIAAKKWAEKHFMKGASIGTEVYDLGIVPFNELSANITLCDFYSYETNPLPCNGISWKQQREKSTYIILPSQRIIKSRMVNAKRYPMGHTLYKTFLQNRTEFKKVYETPCDIYCNILYLGSPTYAFEQTANVFDRPTVYIFEKKNK